MSLTKIDTIFTDIKTLIEESKKTVALQVNSTLTLMYWHIGKYIKDAILKNKRADYGKEVISTLSTQLTKEYGKGYTKRNLENMIRFAQVFEDIKIVHSLSAKLTWTHFKQLIYIENDLKREFYIGMIKLDRWSTRTLKERIDSQLYERIALSKKPDELINYELEQLNKGEVTPDILLKDPYVLSFLELNDRYLEKDLEDAILSELEQFILELGSGFSFIARQKIIQIDDEDEKSPIGIILCADKQSEQIELLELDRSNIHVAQYLTVLPKKELLQEKLQLAIQNAKNRLEFRDEEK